MKKLSLSIALTMAAFMVCKAQSAKVPVNGSYVIVNSKAKVYPYNGFDLDTTIYFYLNKNTKFRIDAALASKEINTGYIISPWEFRESITVSSDRSKKIENKYPHLFGKLKGTSPGNEKKVIDKDVFYRKMQENFEKSKKIALADSDVKVRAEVNYKTAKKLFDADSITLNIAKKTFEENSINVKNLTASILTATANAYPASEEPRRTLISAKAALSGELVKSWTIIDTVKAVQRALKVLEPINDAGIVQVKNNAAVVLTGFAAHSKVLDTIRARYSKSEQAVKEVKARLDDIIAAKGKPEPNQSPEDRNNIYAFSTLKPAVGDAFQNLSVKSLNRPTAAFDSLAYVDSWANDMQFFIRSKVFTENSSAIYPKSSQFTWGFLTLPLKIRFDNSDSGRFNFEQNLNFGITVGRKFQQVNTSDISLSVLGGLSVTSVPLRASSVSTAPTSTAAISLSIGGMFQYDKFQIGMFVGKDFAGDHADQFSYQHKTWLGIAIGFSLFGESKTTADSNSSKNETK